MSREGTDSEHVLESLVAHRPIDQRRLLQSGEKILVAGRFPRNSTPQKLVDQMGRCFGGMYFPRKNGHVILGFLYCVIQGIG
jgi:hypothetical protein